MSEGSLSQDEIDALLQGSNMDFGGGQDSSSGGGGGDEGLSDQQKQRLARIMGDISDSQASNLSGMIGENVSIEAPSVDVMDPANLGASVSGSLVEIKIPYSEGLSGFHSYLLPEDVATAIAGKMMGQEGVEMNDAALSALEEAGNTLAGSAATGLGDLVGTTVMNEPGETKSISAEEVSAPSGQAVMVTYPITIDDIAPSQMYEVLDMSVVQSILQAAGGGAQQQAAGPQQQQQGFGAPQAGAQQQAAQGGQPMFGGGQQQQQTGFGGQQMFGGAGGANVQPVQFPGLNEQSQSGDQGNIGLLMDVYMEMTVELGRTKWLIKDILGMGEGTIVELDKLAGEPVDILVNHKLIAKGEVVVIDENFGVRVTEIVSPMDRVEGMT
jgi:flagellar motor switch protein FliN/FliY